MVSLSLDPPRHGRRNSGGGGSLRTKLLVVLVIFGAGAASGFWAGRFSARQGLLGAEEVEGSQASGAAQQAQAAAAAQAQALAPSDAGGVPAPGSASASATPAGAPPAVAPAAPATAPAQVGMRRASAVVSGALEECITRALAPEDRKHGEQLTQVVNRLLVWHLSVARESLRGDRIEVLWEPAPPITDIVGATLSQEPIVHAVRYASQKLGKEISAYRFQPPGSAWARYYQPDGTELEERLVDSPIADYEQVTSLLRDGRKHQGVDFKTPVGTPVVAPFDGRIVKRNWNFRYNGNCLDILDPASGRHAIFLHLDEVPKEMAVGRTVKKGERIAVSGNTGRSYAPHLHYQLEDSRGRVLDPYTVHATRRVSLSPADKAAFEAARAKLDPIMATASAAAR